MIWIAAALFVLLLVAVHKVNRLDVQTGRREAMALGDDYGSNRSWYWPWTPIIQVSFFGIIFCVFAAL